MKACYFPADKSNYFSMGTFNQFWAFLAAHKPTLIVAAAWFVREVPVVWEGLKQNHGLRGLSSIIMTGQTAEKQAAVAVATLNAISPPPTVIPTIVASQTKPEPTEVIPTTAPAKTV
jgi:hypothetical protein